MGSKVIKVEKIEDVPEKALQKRLDYYRMVLGSEDVDTRQVKQSFIGKYIRVDT